jgi:hypothetical protein
MSEAPTDTRCTQFADYVLATYVSSDARFPPTLWALTDRNIPRTNNACESYHSHLKSTFTSTHPNIFVFIKGILEIQSNAYVQLRSTSIPKVVSSFELAKRQHLNEWFRKYDSHEVTRCQFLHHICYKFLPIQL